MRALVEEDQEIAGIDRDGNGVRDDVDAYIERNYVALPQRAAAVQAAKAMQMAMTVDVKNAVAVRDANNRLARADHCIYLRFDGGIGSQPPARVSQELESIATNTKQRLLAYLAFNRALNGTAWAMPSGDSCE